MREPKVIGALRRGADALKDEARECDAVDYWPHEWARVAREDAALLDSLAEALADVSPCDLVCKPGGGMATEIRTDAGLRRFAAVDPCDCGPCSLASLLTTEED